MKRLFNKFLRPLGHEIVRLSPTGKRSASRAFPPDFDEGTKKLIEYVQPYTMTSMERLFSLRRSVEYIVGSEIQAKRHISLYESILGQN